MTLEDILSEHYKRKIIDVQYDYDGDIYYKYDDNTWSTNHQQCEVIDILVNQFNKSINQTVDEKVIYAYRPAPITPVRQGFNVTTDKDPYYTGVVHYVPEDIEPEHLEFLKLHNAIYPLSLSSHLTYCFM